MVLRDEIIFKNPVIDKMLEKEIRDAALPLSIRNEAIKERYKSISTQEIGEEIIAGYWYSLICEVMMNTLGFKKWIDFTYDTLHNLPVVLTSLYHFQKNNGYSDDRNAVVVAKTIGSIMYGLAMNEHGAKMKVEKGVGSPLWGDSVHIYVDMKKKTDFLEPALKTLKAAPFVVSGGRWFEMTPIIDAYKETTGVNITDYEVGSIMIN